MKLLVVASTLAMLGGLVPVSAQELGDAPVHITLPGITFTRALNGAADGASVTSGRLILKCASKRDNFRDPDGKFSSNNAPVLLTEVDNTKPFTLKAKLTPTFLDTYDAGTLYIWVRDDLWLKMAMERDERGRVRIVSVRTNGTSDDNDHDVVTSKTVYMKISSDTTRVGFYYSVDNLNWQLVRLFKNDYPSRLWVGISTQSPIGKGSETIFENVSLVQNSITDFRMGK